MDPRDRIRVQARRRMAAEGLGPFFDDLRDNLDELDPLPQREARYGLSDPGSNRGNRQHKKPLSPLQNRNGPQREARRASAARADRPGNAAHHEAKPALSGRQAVVIGDLHKIYECDRSGALPKHRARISWPSFAV